MEKKKMTKKDYFKMLLEIKDVTSNEDLVKFINNELELLNKKSASKTVSKTQEENNKIKEIIISELEKIAKPVTITELQELSESLASYGNQKLTALMTQLNDKGNGIVKRDYIKRKAYFSIKDNQDNE